jgi:hypothetical protein
MSCLKIFSSSKNDGSRHDKKSCLKPDWYREFFAELFGTFFIVVSIELF